MPLVPQEVAATVVVAAAVAAAAAVVVAAAVAVAVAVEGAVKLSHHLRGLELLLLQVVSGVVPVAGVLQASQACMMMQARRLTMVNPKKHPLRVQVREPTFRWLDYDKRRVE